VKLAGEPELVTVAGPAIVGAGGSTFTATGVDAALVAARISSSAVSVCGPTMALPVNDQSPVASTGTPLASGVAPSSRREIVPPGTPVPLAVKLD
jgi:hypothetical protein